MDKKLPAEIVILYSKYTINWQLYRILVLIDNYSRYRIYILQVYPHLLADILTRKQSSLKSIQTLDIKVLIYKTFNAAPTFLLLHHTKLIQKWFSNDQVWQRFVSSLSENINKWCMKFLFEFPFSNVLLIFFY